MDNLPHLAHILADAYGNALMHDKPNADLEAEDLFLESASIRFSGRLLYEISKGSCQPDERADTGTSVEQTCVLDLESVGLRALTDSLSYAAYRLENQGRLELPAENTNGQRALVMARIKTMDHLYRIVWALSRAYLDRSQSGVYLETARKQLELARKQMEIERSLCACGDDGNRERLLELSQIDDGLKEIARRREARP